MITGVPVAGLPAINQILALAIVAGFGVFTTVVGAYFLLVPAVLEQRLAHFVAGAAPTRRTPIDLNLGSPDLLAAIDRQLSRRGRAAGTRLLLQRANLSLNVSEFIGLRIGLGLVCGAIVALLQFSKLGPLSLALGALIGFAASFLPPIILSIVAKRRVAKVESQLPDALDTVAAALQAGAGLSQAFVVITKEMPAPIAEEFTRVLREVEIGLSLNEALGNMATRLGSEDIDLVVTTINIQTRVGGNLVQILRTITRTVRERIRIRGEIVVLSSMQRMSAIVIGAVPPGLSFIIYLMNPSYILRLFVPGIGLAMLMGSVILTVAGVLMLRKITSIDI